MYELSCPSCNSSSQYDFSDRFLMCPFCSCTFKFDTDSGQKEAFSDHYIVSNISGPGQVKELVMEWLRRLHHKPGSVEKEFFVIDISGLSVPFWCVSVEAHTAWKGLVKRQNRSFHSTTPGEDYIAQSGGFRRSYRWCISGRSNICETWGMTRLHEPKESIHPDWDGFPLDSTFSRGQIDPQLADAKNTYDSREFFDFKYSNGLPVLGIQVEEEEALRRAKDHVDRYHQKLAALGADFLVDYRTEHEIAGIQLIHLPFWFVRYVYQPQTALKHLYKSKEKHVIVDGYNHGILKSELAIHHFEKVKVNAVVSGVSGLLFLILGMAIHTSFYFVAGFALLIAGISGYMALQKSAKRRQEELEQVQDSQVAEEIPAAAS